MPPEEDKCLHLTTPVSAPKLTLAAEIHVLSAGAIEPGLIAAADAFRKQSEQDIRITWATTPAIRKRVGDGDAAGYGVYRKPVNEQPAIPENASATRNR